MKNVYTLIVFLLSFISISTVSAQTPPGFQWAVQAGGTSCILVGRSIAKDNNGNTYVTGYLSGTNAVDFDPSPTNAVSLTSLGSNDIIVAKYTVTGALAWAFNVGGNGNDQGLGIAVDSYGSVYVTGYIGLGTTTVYADLDPLHATTASRFTSNGSNDIFIAKYNTNGVYQWAYTMGTSGLDNGNAIAVDKNNNVYVTGSFAKPTTGAVTIDPDPAHTSNASILTSTGNTDVFLTKYNSNGQYQWAFNVGGTGADIGNGIAVDNNYVYLIGSFFSSSNADMDPSPTSATTLTGVGVADMFIAKYTNAGAFVWAKEGGNSALDTPGGIAVDGSGNVYVINSFQSTFKMSGAPDLVTKGGFDFAVVKFNSSGTFQWNFSIGGTQADYGYGIAADADGNIYITGVIYLPSSGSTSIDFDPSTTSTANLVSNGAYDVYLAKYNTSGAYQWAFNAGSSSSDYGYAIAIDKNHIIAITGALGKASLAPLDADFDPIGTASLTTIGTQDLYVANYGEFKKWTGATSTDWNTATNWNTGVVPVAADSVVITTSANKPVIGSGVTAVGAALTVADSSVLTLTGTGTLTVSGNITITPGAALVGSSSNITAGSLTLQQSVIGQRGWRVFANPFIGATNIATTASNNSLAIGTTVPASGLTDSRTYSNSSNAWANVTGTTWAANTPYALFIRGLTSEVTGSTYTGGPSDFTYSVKGSLNGSSVAVNPSTANNFLLVGNPYAAPVTSSALTNGVGKSYYVYQISKGANTTAQRTRAGSWSAVLSSSTTATIPVLGVIAYQPAATTSYNITTANINTGGTVQGSLFRTAGSIENLELIVNKGTAYQDKLFVRIGNKDNNLTKLTNDDVNVYTITGNDHLAVDAREKLEQTIPMGITAAAGTYTFEVANNNLENTTVYLKDKLLNTLTELQEGVTYSFEITADASTKGDNRFELTFEKKVTPIVLNPAFSVKLLGNTITKNEAVRVSITGSTHAMIQVKDMSGRIITTASAVNGINTINLSSSATGMYIIQVTDGNAGYTGKLIKQ